jgi:hypothetical protein
MKKVFYILAVVAALSTSLISCTDESVKPKTENGSGSPSDPIIK